MASRLQASLLPATCPQQCEHYSVWAVNRMCSGVGGDFYDFIRINDDQIAIVIGDVEGHGVRAALVMAQVMGFLRTANENVARPARMLDMLNTLLLDIGDKLDQMVTCTMFYVVIDTPSGSTYYVNAGHPMPLLVVDGGGDIKSIGTTDLVLGVENFKPVEGCHTFSEGERLVLYTDGIIETVGSENELFGRSRLKEVVQEYIDHAPRQCAEGILDAVEIFRAGKETEDDQTVIVVDRI